ncbi:MAG: hypothetical protein HC824_19960 [Synechococcales cyanobacterium RM1_1_8]|nr:hypothetical protein [Synechococcales cyanobacterium RM1_1_8]
MASAAMGVAIMVPAVGLAMARSAQASPGEASPALAQTQPQAENLQNQTETTEPPSLPPLSLEKPDRDELLPGEVKGRSLNPTEQQRLRLGLVRLMAAADRDYVQNRAENQTEDPRDRAFRQYFRILSLSQYLSPEEELIALARVGDRAWRANRSNETQLITARLTQLEQQELSPKNLKPRGPKQRGSAQQGPKQQEGDKPGGDAILRKRRLLAEAYERSGAWGKAIAQYETLLILQQPTGEKAASEAVRGENVDPISGAFEEVISGAASGSSLVSGSALALSEPSLVRRLAQLHLLNLSYPSAATYSEQALVFALEEADDQETEAGAAPLPSIPPASILPGQDLPADLGSALENWELPASPINSTQGAGSDSDPGSNAGSNAGSNPGSGAVLGPLPSELPPEMTPRRWMVQLAYIYEQDQRFAEAAAVQQQLLPLYGGPLEVSQQPALRVAIAQNQAQAGQWVEAIASYQAAYGQAQEQQQFGVSHQALAQLAALYLRQGQPLDALVVYNILLQVDELSYNLQGLTDTQASRAEIFQGQQRPELARQAYDQAIHTARLLNYRLAELEQRRAALPAP